MENTPESDGGNGNTGFEKSCEDLAVGFISYRTSYPFEEKGQSFIMPGIKQSWFRHIIKQVVCIGVGHRNNQKKGKEKEQTTPHQKNLCAVFFVITFFGRRAMQSHLQ